MGKPATAIDFAAQAQGFFPGQTYNATAIAEFTGMIEGGTGNLLDIGCGDAFMLRLLAARYPQMQLAGLTISESELKACGNQFDVRIGNMHALPWLDESIDIATSRHSLEHSISPLTALFEMNRVLRPGGKAYVVVPAPVNEGILRMPDHFSVLPRIMWEKLFGDAGFEILSFIEGTWLWAASQAEEPEYRFALRKIRGLQPGSIPDETPSRLSVFTSPVGASLVQEKPIIAVIHNMDLFNACRPMLEPLKDDVKVIVPQETTDEGVTVANFIVATLRDGGWNVEAAALPLAATCEIELSSCLYTAPNVREARCRVRFIHGKDALPLEENAAYDFVLTAEESVALSVFTSPMTIGKGADAPERATAFLRHLLVDANAIPPEIKEARRLLRERLARGPAEFAARQMAEKQLHAIHHATKAQLLTDLRSSMDIVRKLSVHLKEVKGM